MRFFCCCVFCLFFFLSFFFFNDTATTEIYTLSLHDALPISSRPAPVMTRPPSPSMVTFTSGSSTSTTRDRKSTRLNSSHANISYAVFCLKKKKKKNKKQKKQKKKQNKHQQNKERDIMRKIAQ